MKNLKKKHIPAKVKHQNNLYGVQYYKILIHIQIRDTSNMVVII